MTINNKKAIKRNALSYTGIAVLSFCCTVIGLLNNQFAAFVFFASLTLTLMAFLTRLQYTEIENGGMFISIKKCLILEKKKYPVFEIPYTDITDISIIDKNSGHLLIMNLRNKKKQKSVFRIFMQGMEKRKIHELKISVMNDFELFTSR